MKPRTLTLVIFLVLCASLVAAFPQGEEYQDSEFFEEFGDYATGAWNCMGVSLEPFMDVLSVTATNDTTFFNHSDDVRSMLDGSQAGSSGNVDDRMQVPSQTTLLAFSADPSPTEMFQSANVEPNMTGIEFERTAFPDLTDETLAQLDAQPSPLPDDLSMEAWVMNSPYLPGYRSEPSTSAFPGWADPQQLQHLPVTSLQPTQSTTTQLRPLMPAPTTNPTAQPAPSIRPWPCNHPDCDYAGRTEQDLRHHIRYHTPMPNRPHGCPYCHQRFLSPREVERHLPTHGLGRRYYCHEPSCMYARRGFGRRDHLRRHVRSQHGVDSGQGSSEVGSVSGG